jgi:hypothetical protein
VEEAFCPEKFNLLGREQVSRKLLGEQAFFDNPATPFLDT